MRPMSGRGEIEGQLHVGNKAWILIWVCLHALPMMLSINGIVLLPWQHNVHISTITGFSSDAYSAASEYLVSLLC